MSPSLEDIIEEIQFRDSESRRLLTAMRDWLERGDFDEPEHHDAFIDTLGEVDTYLSEP